MENLTDKFVKEIERRILTGQWETGMKLPSSRALAEEFFVSRSVISVGIAQLCRNGYLQTAPRGQVYVADWKKMGNVSLVGSLIDNGLLTAETIDNLLESRMALEKTIVAKAALSRTEEDLEYIHQIIEDEKNCTSIDEIVVADEAFHHAMVAASHNIVYTIMFNSFSTITEKLTQRFYETTNEHEYVITMHEAIYEAIKNQDVTLTEKLLEDLLAHGEVELRKQEEN